VIDLDRLVELLAAKYRWGLHPFKLLIALIAPVLAVWLADRRLRALASATAEQKPPARRLPRARRR
jgi:hypothetical protein